MTNVVTLINPLQGSTLNPKMPLGAPKSREPRSEPHSEFRSKLLKANDTNSEIHVPMSTSLGGGQEGINLFNKREKASNASPIQQTSFEEDHQNSYQPEPQGFMTLGGLGEGVNFCLSTAHGEDQGPPMSKTASIGSGRARAKGP